MSRMIPACVLVLALSAPAAAPDIAGTWKVTLEAVKRDNPDGGSVSMPKQEGVMSLTQKGRELAGAWGLRESWTLSGRIEEKGTFQLRSGDRDLRVTNNGKETSVKAHWEFAGELKDGALGGTAFLQFGDRPPVPRRWSAVRQH